MSIGPRAFLAVLVLAPFAGWPAATSAGVVVVGPVPPSVTYIGVESGQAGASVPIIGSALEGATEVRFGGRPAPTFTVRSPIEIVAEAPEGEGTVDVTVTTPAGMSRSGYGDLFTYLAPTPIGSQCERHPLHPPGRAARRPRPPPPPARNTPPPRRRQSAPPRTRRGHARDHVLSTGAPAAPGTGDGAKLVVDVRGAVRALGRDGRGGEPARDRGIARRDSGGIATRDSGVPEASVTDRLGQSELSSWAQLDRGGVSETVPRIELRL